MLRITAAMGRIHSGMPGDRFKVLGKVANFKARAFANPTVIDLVFPEDEPEQSGLSHSVGPDEPYACTRPQVYRGVFQEDLSGKLFADRLKL
jgi:hypothetical protein